ncbi:MAG: alpha/beta hydrolase, partial [Ignavibacteriae bacterium]
MKPFLICALLSINGSIAAAQNKIIPIWQIAKSNTERYVQLDQKNSGNITEVHEPTLTVFLPSRRDARHPAVLVFPGGAYRQIVIGKEGYSIARWLNDHGIAAFVLTYRLDRDSALLDAQQALRLIRSNAGEYTLDPDRIGVMGFSAGANLSLNLATHPRTSFHTTEHLDTVSCRPDFMVLVYGGFRGL